MTPQLGSTVFLRNFGGGERGIEAWARSDVWGIPWTPQEAYERVKGMDAADVGCNGTEPALSSADLLALRNPAAGQQAVDGGSGEAGVPVPVESGSDEVTDQGAGDGGEFGSGTSEKKPRTDSLQVKLREFEENIEEGVRIAGEAFKWGCRGVLALGAVGVAWKIKSAITGWSEETERQEARANRRVHVDSYKHVTTYDAAQQRGEVTRQEMRREAAASVTSQKPAMRRYIKQAMQPGASRADREFAEELQEFMGGSEDDQVVGEGLFRRFRRQFIEPNPPRMPNLTQIDAMSPERDEFVDPDPRHRRTWHTGLFGFLARVRLLGGRIIDLERRVDVRDTLSDEGMTKMRRQVAREAYKDSEHLLPKGSEMVASHTRKYGRRK